MFIRINGSDRNEISFGGLIYYRIEILEAPVQDRTVVMKQECSVQSNYSSIVKLQKTMLREDGYPFSSDAGTEQSQV